MLNTRRFGASRYRGFGKAFDPGNVQSGYVLVEHDGKEIRKVLDVNAGMEAGIWQGKKESDDAIHRLDSSLKKLCGPFFQPFFERNDTIKDWWVKE